MSLSRFSRPRWRITFAVRISALLILAVVLPLVITVLGSELVLRPTLLAQASTEQENDALYHTQAIDSLLIARLQNLDYLGQYFAIQKFLSGDTTYKTQALDELALGYRLDPNYSAWTLFDTQGNVLLSYPTIPTPRGKYMVPPEALQSLLSGNKTLISDVYFDSNNHMAYVDIYASITASGKMIGLGRSTLKLSDVWTAINNETNAAPGSYAMILDGHGVRIAYTNQDTTLTTLPQGLFQAVAPLSTDFQQRIQNENLYGNSQTPVRVLADPTLAQQQKQASSVFQLTPALQQDAFQAVQVSCHVVPWTYIVLRPVNSVTQAANQQDAFLSILALIVTLLAALAGLLLSRTITRPILSSVSSLTQSSEMLKKLSDSEQVTATEQQWIVEASRNGLKAVEYYTDASSVAARKLRATGQELSQNLLKLDSRYVQKHLGEMVAAAQYIEKAASYQEQSSKSLSTAIRVNTQITEQLVSGATSAADAATQLEMVIAQLHRIIGE